SVHRRDLSLCYPKLAIVNHSSRFRSLLCGVACLVTMIFTFGCATIQGEKYTYDTMPQYLIAGVRENPQTVDLTRLASATTNSDVLDRGDVVEVTIAAGLTEKDTIKIPVRIQDDGYGDLPEIGRVQLAGMKITAAEASIYHESVKKGLYRSPTVTVR